MQNNTFVRYWCGGEYFGPWDHSSKYAHFTWCSVGLMTSVLRLVALPMLVARYVQAFMSDTMAPRRRSIKFRIQIACCAVLALLSNVEVLLILIDRSFLPYTIVTSVLGSVAWMLSVLVMIEERVRFLPRSFWLRAWWILELFSNTLQVPTLVSDYRFNDRLRFAIYVIVPKIFVAFVLCLFLLFKGSGYLKPPRLSSSDAAAAATAEAAAAAATSSARMFPPKVSSPSLAMRPSASSEPQTPSGRAAFQMYHYSEDSADDDGARARPEDLSGETSALLGGQHSIAGGTATAATAAAAGNEPDPIGWLSFIGFGFVKQLLRIGGEYRDRTKFDLKDLMPIGREDRATVLLAKFKRIWAQESQKRRPSLVRVFAKMFWRPFLASGILKLFGEAMTFASPAALWFVIKLTEADSKLPWWTGFVAAAATAAVVAVGSIVHNHFMYLSFVIAQRVRSTIIMAVYRKSLLLSNLALHRHPPGTILSHLSVDPSVIVEACPDLHVVWSAPLEIAASLVLSVYIAGWPAAVGAVLMIVTAPVNIQLARLIGAHVHVAVAHKESRMKLLGEVLGAMKTVKLMVWEASLHGQLSELRRKEAAAHFRALFIRALIIVVIWITPLLASLATFILIVFVQKSKLTAMKGFMSIILFNVINSGMVRLFKVVIDILQSAAGIRRLTGFLQADELDARNVEVCAPILDSPAVVLENATFVWEDTQATALNRVSVAAETGELVAVIGHVGAGKSTLMRALLGSLRRTEGRALICGQVAYAAQRPWIQNATLRENVTFGKRFDGDLYERTVRACELRRDDMVSVGDDDRLGGGEEAAEFGEAGIALSGSQRQRVGLARAAYQDADIYVLDDVIGADAAIGESVFRGCICGLLRGKTRIFTTHQYQYLSRCDRILVLKNSSVVEQGTFEQLASSGREDSEFTRLYRTYVEAQQAQAQAHIQAQQQAERQQQKASRSMSATSIVAAASPAALPQESGEEAAGEEEEGGGHDRKKAPNGRQRVGQKGRRGTMPAAGTGEGGGGGGDQAAAEDQERHGVPTETYMLYLREAGLLLFTAALAFYVISSAATTGANYWLSFLTQWAVMESPPQTVEQACGVYAVFVGVTVVTLFLRFSLLCRATVSAGVQIHDRVLGRVLRGTMSFFNTTPAGRLLNRFSEDMATVDDKLNLAALTFFGMFFGVVLTVTITIAVLPFFVPFVFPLLFLYSYVQEWFVVYARELFKLNAIGRSPLNSRFAETVAQASGLDTIRSMRQARRFVAEVEERLDLQQRAYYAQQVADRWLGVRIDCIGALVFAVSVTLSAAERGKVEGQLLCLPTIGAAALLVVLPQLVQSVADLKLSMISVQRLTRLLTEVPQEAPVTDREALFVPPQDWPRLGKVEFRNFYLQYTPDLPPAVTNLSIVVPPGEKVGIVGKAGAGKSSLIVALFRLAEASGGCVLIDDIDISRVSLTTLRSRLCVIPQDPVLFRGTLRRNLDVIGGSRSDEELLEALDAVGMRQAAIESLALQRGHQLKDRSDGESEGDRAVPPPSATSCLDLQVAEGGSNLSIGERQLICLARGLLGHASVIILDEATANVDLATEERIQHTVFTKCARSTILLIAHRAHTIMRCDRVLLMEKGSAVAFGPPAKVAKECKAFADLLQDAGPGETSTAEPTSFPPQGSLEGDSSSDEDSLDREPGSKGLLFPPMAAAAAAAARRKSPLAATPEPMIPFAATIGLSGSPSGSPPSAVVRSRQQPRS